MSARARESARVRCRARAQRSKVLLGVVIINQTRCRVVIDQRAAPHLALHRSRAPPAHYDPCLSGVRRCACGARRSTGVLPTTRLSRRHAQRGSSHSSASFDTARVPRAVLERAALLLPPQLRDPAAPRLRGSTAPRLGSARRSAARRGAARRGAARRGARRLGGPAWRGAAARPSDAATRRRGAAVRRRGASDRRWPLATNDRGGATRVVVVMVVVTTARACHAEEIPGCATSHWPNKRRSTKAGSGFFLPREPPLRALLFFSLFFLRQRRARVCYSPVCD